MAGNLRELVRRITAPFGLWQLMSLVKRGLRRLVRVHVYSIEALDLQNYPFGRFTAKIPLECKSASEEDMLSMFNNWPDSQEEYDRHYGVYFDLSFKRCFLFYHRDTGEIVHFQFLHCFRDRPQVRRLLPRKAYRYLADETCAYLAWAYTFEKFRRQGIALAATDHTLRYCKESGVKTAYGHRGLGNLPSVGMGKKTGFVMIAKHYHFQFLWQTRHRGIHIVRPVRKHNRGKETDRHGFRERGRMA